MKPSDDPGWDQHHSRTPRTASVRWLEDADVVHFQEQDMHPDWLCEILPVGAVVDDDLEEWVWVAVTVDLPGTNTTASEVGWIARARLERLPPLRWLAVQAPDGVIIGGGRQRRNKTVISEQQNAERQGPAKRTYWSVRPADGPGLLAAWEAGHRPVMTTWAYLDRAETLVDAEPLWLARRRLQLGQLDQHSRRIIIRVLRAVIDIAGTSDEWPCWTAEEIDLVRDDPVDDADIPDDYDEEGR